MTDDRVVRRFSKQFLRECFIYSSDTGELVWRHRPVHHFNSLKAQRRCNTLFAGREAGHPHVEGYVVVKLCGLNILTQHVCWVLGTGEYPKDELDHINGKRKDNRLVNLRDVTRTLNQKNVKIRKDNVTGTPGVRPYVCRGKYRYFRAYAAVSGKQRFKSFKTLEAAIEWRNQMVAMDGDYHPNHGRIQ